MAASRRPVSNASMKLSRRNIWFLVVMCLLVLALRLWADYDQALLRASWPDRVPLLLNHAPGDTFRFVFNFPASLLARWTFPPPITERFIGLEFVRSEGLSIALELAFTAAWWLLVFWVLRTKWGSRLKRLPMRVVLPVTLLLISATLNYYGQLQYDSVRHVGAHREEETFGRDWFVGYAINAPAYVACRALVRIPSFNDGLWDLYIQLPRSVTQALDRIEYFGSVLLLWFLIGAAIDRRRGLKGEPLPSGLSWRRRSGWMACVLGGGFLCALAVGAIYEPRSWQETWFLFAILLWGTLLIAIGSRILTNDTGYRAIVGRVFSAMIGVLASCLALPLLFQSSDRFRLLLDAPAISIAIWASCMFVFSLYTLSKKRPRLQ